MADAEAAVNSSSLYDTAYFGRYAKHFEFEFATEAAKVPATAVEVG
jgi:hypothetical protein